MPQTPSGFNERAVHPISQPVIGRTTPFGFNSKTIVKEEIGGKFVKPWNDSRVIMRFGTPVLFRRTAQKVAQLQGVFPLSQGCHGWKRIYQS